jgi:formate hydrogenlyase subunit 6/NADH:ubiquinone oxidoreductase subunit I
MSLIALDATRCVRSLARESQCNKCEVICPTDAIVIADNPLPAINFSTCVGCGACDAICPSEALSLDTFTPTNFFFEFLDSKENLISCRKNVPCIAALNVENIISISVLKKELILDMGHCDACAIAHTCKPQILKNYEEATYILSAMENEAKITLEDIAYESQEEKNVADRREFFRSINLGGVAKSRYAFESEVKKATDELVEHILKKEDIALLKRKRVPDKRNLLYTAMKRVEKPSQFHIVDATELSFTSQKLLNEESCTACQMCYRVCPTGALTSDIKNSKIDFDPFVCIKCNICHDVCEPKAITLSSSYDIKEFFEPAVQNLISFKVRRCDECNMIFSTNSSDKMCYRCKAEDEEARELWGIPKDIDL